MSMPLCTLHLSCGMPCKYWVLPKNIARLFLWPAPGAMHSSPCSAKVHLGWWNTILNKQGGSVCQLSPQGTIQGLRSSQQCPGNPWAVSRHLWLRGAKSQNSLVFLVHQRTTYQPGHGEVLSHICTQQLTEAYTQLYSESLQIHAKVLLLGVIWSLGDLRKPAALIRARNLTGQRQDRYTGDWCFHCPLQRAEKLFHKRSTCYRKCRNKWDWKSAIPHEYIFQDWNICWKMDPSQKQAFGECLN